MRASNSSRAKIAAPGGAYPPTFPPEIVTPPSLIFSLPPICSGAKVVLMIHRIPSAGGTLLKLIMLRVSEA